MSNDPHSQTGHKLIESDRIIERAVYDHDGKPVGKICRLLIERRSGHVQRVVVETHGLFGLGAHEYEVPWGTLSYDTRLPGYRTTLRKAEITAQKSTFLTGETEFS